MKKHIIIIYVLIGFVFSVNGQNNTLFEKGKEYYKAEKYQKAVSTWAKILDNGKHSDALYFNMANAYYKLNEIGPAIYYYEKALLLNPSDSDIKSNLAFAQNATIDIIEPLPETLFKKWYNTVSGLFTFNGWAKMTVLFVFLLVFFFLTYYFSISERRKRLLFGLSIVMILAMVVSLIFSYATYQDALHSKPAIIFAETTQIKSGPTLSSETLFTLNEGTKVEILEYDTDWVHIELADGKEGWIPLTDLKAL